MAQKLCPYNVRSEQVVQLSFEYNEAGLEVKQEQKLIERAEPMPCAGKSCGAYHFGRCMRRG